MFCPGPRSFTSTRQGVTKGLCSKRKKGPSLFVFKGPAHANLQLMSEKMSSYYDKVAQLRGQILFSVLQEGRLDWPKSHTLTNRSECAILQVRPIIERKSCVLDIWVPVWDLKMCKFLKPGTGRNHSAMKLPKIQFACLILLSKWSWVEIRTQWDILESLLVAMGTGRCVPTHVRSSAAHTPGASPTQPAKKLGSGLVSEPHTRKMARTFTLRR